eukprot:TRINITY_DN6130_c0_g1_i1.p1 TRINITY_DN6130_c0_g1~~TRINITY_DN6130_c0_g1_i1.p1  ORF type:complete len:103 (-),score=22.50 TRINITY_DN6130_c0_g1_i1:94-402(-)
MTSLTRVLTVKLFTKVATPCSLCAEAKENIDLASRQVQDRIKVELVDIEALGHESWNEKYMFDIPVGHVDGKEIFRHRIESAEMVKFFQEWERDGNGDGEEE